MLLGEKAVERLAGCHVAVFGLGGVGSYTVEALTRAGMGSLTLVDGDTINESNLNRQLFALRSTIGRLKTEVARERIADINPGCKVSIISEFCLSENIELFFRSHYDYIADAVDMPAAKTALAVKAQQTSTPIIACMGAGNKLDTGFRVSDIYATSVCPLCRVMRRQLKDAGVAALKTVWSDQAPVRAPDGFGGEAPGRTPGSISFAPAAAGLKMAEEIIMDLTGARR
ncbi:MAG TPA: tRNA threonylcarbamoyladenosine dehydratase [Clostridiales bacterium]|nr:tRNA threonylcarbamoyladenosine dehydratase [Clostridiales bacterium]